jgi:3-oxoacyl-[acyl-carrier-protein] synthase II
MTPPRIVITGFGLLCPMADSLESFCDGLYAGRTCMSPLEGWEPEEPRFSYGGQLKDFDFTHEMPEVNDKHILRYSQFSMVAAKRAIAHAGIDLNTVRRERFGTSFGTAAAGLGETVHIEVARYFKRGDHGVSPLAWAEFTPCACSTHVAIHFGLRGPISTHSSGCVSGIDALIWGVKMMREGRVDAMIIGGADAPFYPFIWAGLYRSGILAAMTDDGIPIPRPFSQNHNGIVLVEGGSAVIIEREDHARLRGATIYGEILGTASVEEARPLWDLDPSGLAYAETIRRTLLDAGEPVTAIDWVCAHGTGYPGADCAESRGIETALGEYAYHVPVSSIRGAVGQSFASGGGFQLAAACLALREQRVPATLNFSGPAEDCRLDYVPNVPRRARVRTAMVCTAGVGGTHAGVLVRAYTP